MICHFNLDTFELLEKTCNLNEKERMARQNHPLTVCSSATISQEPLMEAFGRPGVVIRTFLEYLKSKKAGGILQSGSQKTSAQTPESLQGQNGSKRVPGF